MIFILQILLTKIDISNTSLILKFTNPDFNQLNQFNLQN